MAILLNLAAIQPETRLTEVRARKNDDSTEFRIYHTTLCSYHTTPQENQISGVNTNSFTSKWQARLMNLSRPRAPLAAGTLAPLLYLVENGKGKS